MSHDAASGIKMSRTFEEVLGWPSTPADTSRAADSDDEAPMPPPMPAVEPWADVMARMFPFEVRYYFRGVW